MLRHPRVKVDKDALITALSQSRKVRSYMHRLGESGVVAMKEGQYRDGEPVSTRVHRETFYRYYRVGPQERPVIVVTAGRGTGRGKRYAGFFAAFHELGTRKMRRQTFMRESMRAWARQNRLVRSFWKRGPIDGGVEWHQK